MNYLKEYYKEIQKGNIIIGNELRVVLDRLIADLDNPRYTYDEKPGQIRIVSLRHSVNILSHHLMGNLLFLNYGKKQCFKQPMDLSLKIQA